MSLSQELEKGKESRGPDINQVRTESQDSFQTFLDPHEHPQNLPVWRKWFVVAVISSAALCVTSASSLAAFVEVAVSEEFHVGREVAILAISLYVLGNGVGPLLVGPLSEVYGRNAIYWTSYILFFAFTWPVAFAPHIAVYLIFRFITGFCASAFLSVAGGSISDLFSDAAVANPMALYTISPFLGPVLGPLIAGFITQHLHWRWTYYVLLVWIFGEIILLLLIPETFVPRLIQFKAAKLRKDTKDSRYWAPLDRHTASLAHSILISCYMPFHLLLTDRMALLLDIWTSLVLGILYLSFQAFPLIFQVKHGFDIQSTGMSFLGIGVGLVLALSTQPFWNRIYKKAAQQNKGAVPPETRLIMGMAGGVLIPIGLFWLAFTTFRGVPWIVPILASVPFGAGILFVYTSTFTYLVTAYRPIAASAMAANSTMRSVFAASFPLFAGAMYHRLGTVGATALLASLMTVMAPLPFILYRIGARLRKNSKFTLE